jgi:hypothetical protein
MAAPIRQEVVFKAGPRRIYDALLYPDRFSQLSAGPPAQIDRNPGGSFSCLVDVRSKLRRNADDGPSRQRAGRQCLRHSRRHRRWTGCACGV